MLCEYSHAKSKNLAQIHTTMAEMQYFFLGDCMFTGTPFKFLNSSTPCTQFLPCYSILL